MLPFARRSFKETPAGDCPQLSTFGPSKQGYDMELSGSLKMFRFLS
jgi:hypothetical protein